MKMHHVECVKDITSLNGGLTMHFREHFREQLEAKVTQLDEAIRVVGDLPTRVESVNPLRIKFPNWSGKA